MSLFTVGLLLDHPCNQHKLRKFINGSNKIFNQHISDIFNLMKHFFDKHDLDLSLIGSIFPDDAAQKHR